MIDELTRDKVDRIRSLTIEEASSSITLAYDAKLTLVLTEPDDEGNPVKRHFTWVIVPALSDEGPVIDLYPAGLNPECCPYLEDWLERYVVGQFIRRGKPLCDYREPSTAEESE